MGESKRRKVHDTLDGGPLSGDRIALELCTFSPTPDALMSGDPHCLVTMRELFQRMHTRPTPLCSACDYEFEFGAWPPLAYFTRPAFPKADAYTFVSGAICAECARLPQESLMQALVKYLLEIKPDAEILRPQ